MADQTRFTIDRRMWIFVGRGAILGLLIGTVLSLVDDPTGLRQPIALTLGLPAVIGVLTQVVRFGVVDTAPPLRTPPPDVSVPEYFMRLRQLERRLESAAASPDDYAWSIQPMLVQLASDRLFYRHGIRYLTQPDRAREIVGEQLWEIMKRQAPKRSVDRAQLTMLVSRIEQL